MKRYSMYTTAGNVAVHRMVQAARTQNLTWPEVLHNLHYISVSTKHGEATDTAVRESVYQALFIKG